MTRKPKAPSTSETLWPDVPASEVPGIDQRVGEIMLWASKNDEDWLLEFVEKRLGGASRGSEAPVARPLPAAEELASRFSLTPAQARVLSEFLEGRTLREIAVDQKVKISTVRSHFVDVRGKLGARDQADVVRIALLGNDEGRV
ncbi:MAG: helix-turn-helix transcriptional regulator [Rhodobiaceae bacterium]|nr:helix-turn-helix transcriptional regulator [Rhodobiaceae bacterium]